MESGGSSKSQHRNIRRVPSSGIVIREPNATADVPSDGSNPNPQQTFMRTSDQYVPIANVIRIMRRILPPHAKIADDAKETIQECVTEFISFITNEANEKCHRECRKTISAEDILSAMGTLGFDNYVEPLTAFLNKYRAQDPERSVVHQVPFARRNAGFVQLLAAQMAHPPPQGSPTTMGYAPPPPPSYPIDEPPLNIDDYLTGNKDGEESSSAAIEFDPSKESK